LAQAEQQMTVETILLTYKYRLNPEARQHRALERILEQQRQLYNAALEERIDCYRKTGKGLSDADQSRSLTQIRADDPAFAAVQRRIQRETLRRLDRAYKAFFRRAKAGAGAASGFPRFKGRDHFDGFGFDAFQQVRFDGRALRFSGMPGALRVHLDRPLPQVPDPETGELRHDIRNIWFKREAGRWYCGLQVVVPVRADRTGLGKAPVGVDWGTSVLAALSTGETIPNPRPGEALAADLARAQRAVYRKKKGSRRRLKARRHLQAVHRRIANRRRNHLNKVSARLVRHFGVVAVEDLNVQGLMDAAQPGESLPEFVKRRRNREALDAAPYLLRRMLSYKARRERANLIVVDAANTTQECSLCGGLHFKEPGEAVHTCTTPGVFFGRTLPRKVNAARVILRRALSPSGDGDRGGTVPGGLDGGDAAARNAGNGLRRLGNTEGGRPPTGRRSRKGVPIHARTHDPEHRRRSRS
jgi:putative transposase